MKRNGKRWLITGIAFIAAFAVWTALIMTVDVQPRGQNGTNIGFAGFNLWFHGLTGVHMTLYTITDWLGLVPIAVCMMFGVIGLVQLIRRRSLLKVDRDLIALGICYIMTIAFYILFEMIPINYRPIPIDGFMEASYPSSTTLLVLSVMPTLMEQACRRLRSRGARLTVCAAAAAFSAFTVIGRTVSGVHWFTDIAGSVLLAAGLFSLYRAAALLWKNKNTEADCGIQ